MVSPSKSRGAANDGGRRGFSGLQATDNTRKGVSQRRARSGRKYEVPTDAEKRDIKRITEHVRRSLAPFRERFSSDAAATTTSETAIPAMATIQAFVQRLDRDQDVLVSDFRKCLYALGVAADDAATLLDVLDPRGTGAIGGGEFAKTFLSASAHSPTTQRQRRTETDSNGNNVIVAGKRDRDRSPTAGKDSLQVREFHQRVIERVMVRYSSIKDAFRQYDTSRRGVLSYPQFRLFMRDLGFLGADVERLMHHLDASGQQCVAFNSFSNGTKHSPDQSYMKVSPKRKAVEPLSSKDKQRNAMPQDDRIQDIRTKMRQRVMGGNKSIREVFMNYDQDGNGYLDYEEFKQFMRTYQFTPEEMDIAIEFLDKDYSGTIDYDEFAAGLLFYKPDPKKLARLNNHDKQSRHGKYLLNVVRERVRASIKKKSKHQLFDVREEFKKFDSDGSEALDPQEFSAFLVGLGVKLSSHDLNALMDVVDKDGSNKIDFDEFDAIFCEEDSDSSDDNEPEPLSDKQHSKQSSTASIQKPKSVASPSRKQTSTTPNFEKNLIKRILKDHHSLEMAFKQHDEDGNGELDHQEFRRFMKHYGVRNDRDINDLISKLDTDESGTISCQEFVQHFLPSAKRASDASNTDSVKQRLAALRELEVVWMEEVLQHHNSLEEAFRQFDRDERNELDYEQFRDLMGQYGISEESNIRLLLKRLDADNSGTVSLAEFKEVFNPQRIPRRIKPSSSPPTKSKKPNVIEVQQAKAKAIRIRLLEEQWVKAALAAHDSVKDAFDAFDSDKSGELDHEEFRQLMIAYGIDRQDDIDTLIKKIDVDRSGTIEYDEFASTFFEGRVRTSVIGTPTSSHRPSDSSSLSKGARMRELEVRWMKNVLTCHPSIEAAFREYDLDGSGELDHEEFTRFMKRYGISSVEDIDRLIRRLDLDGSGTIDLTEFMSIFNPLRCEGYSAGRTLLTVEEEPVSNDELESVLEIERQLAERILRNTRDLRAAFRKFDANGNGKLEYKEFRAVLKSYKFHEMEIRKVIRHLDRDVSGYIDYREFTSAFAIVNGSDGKSSSYQVVRKRRSSDKKHSPSRAQATRFGRGGVQGDSQGSFADELKRRLLHNILSSHVTVQSAFRKFDSDKRGSLDLDQFRLLAETYGLRDDESDVLMKALDRDNSGAIDYEEFLSQLVMETG
ncbi:hypothetical protein PINS_up009029 [Pythium insidiosum]|nr:hypothetical protein PINS_up009029 [Pythium insidiosum]